MELGVVFVYKVCGKLILPNHVYLSVFIDSDTQMLVSMKTCVQVLVVWTQRTGDAFCQVLITFLGFLTCNNFSGQIFYAF